MHTAENEDTQGVAKWLRRSVWTEIRQWEKDPKGIQVRAAPPITGRSGRWRGLGAPRPLRGFQGQGCLEGRALSQRGLFLSLKV